MFLVCDSFISISVLLLLTLVCTSVYLFVMKETFLGAGFYYNLYLSYYNCESSASIWRAYSKIRYLKLWTTAKSATVELETVSFEIRYQNTFS